MKKAIVILLVFSFLTSCGPHRMRCGATGICDAPTSKKHEKNS